MTFFSIIWSIITGAFFFFFGSIIFFTILYLPLSFLLKQLAKVIPKFNFTQRISTILVWLIIPISSGISIYLIFHEKDIVAPFKAKLFKYPATEVSIKFSDELTDTEQIRLQSFILKSFSKSDRKIFKGGNSYRRGKIVRRHPNGYIHHYWKRQNKTLYIYLSQPLLSREKNRLEEKFNIWFPENGVRKRLMGNGVIIESINSLNSTEFPFLQRKESRKIRVNLKSLTLRENEYDLVSRKSVNIGKFECYAEFDMESEIYINEIKEMEGNTHFYLQEFNKVAFEATLANNKKYIAYLLSYPIYDDHRTSMTRVDKVKQNLILIIGRDGDCHEKILDINNELYQTFLLTKIQDNIPSKKVSIEFKNLEFSPFYDEVHPF